MSTNLCYFLLAFQAAVAFAAVDNSFVRIQHGEPGNRKMVSLMNSDQIVNFLLESDGAIVDCHVYRRKEILLKIFKFEADENSDEPGVERLQTELDVPWYVRRCRKYLRDLQRTGDRSNPLISEVLDRQSLNKAVEGTKFCTRMASTWNSNLDFPDLTPTDLCCKGLHGCEWSLAPFHYQRGKLNVQPYYLYSCRCMEEFKKCLDGVEGVEGSAEVRRLFFEVLQPKCFEVKEKSRCLKYSTWFDQCLEEETVKAMDIRQF